MESKSSYEDKYGRCSAFPYLKNKIEYLVTGIGNQEYYYCSSVRENEDMCGKEGKKYIEYNEDQNYKEIRSFR